MNGAISFFDILGYRNFLENNSAIETAEQVLKFIASAGKGVSQDLDDRFSGGEHSDIRAAIAVRSQWIVFSDTIIQTIRTDNCEGDNPFLEIALLIESIACSAVLQYKMFNYGLPTKAVLHFGEYLAHENCLAGKAVVEAFTHLERVDFSGIIVTEAFMEMLREAEKSNFGVAVEDFRRRLVQYLVPLSDGSETRMWVLDFTYRAWADEPLKSADLQQMVREKFWAFEKSISLRVEKKVQNTEKLLRYFRFLAEKGTGSA
jgi:hypothetical protein